jgi:hypothetical protein
VESCSGDRQIRLHLEDKIANFIEGKSSRRDQLPKNQEFPCAWQVPVESACLQPEVNGPKSLAEFLQPANTLSSGVPRPMTMRTGFIQAFF